MSPPDHNRFRAVDARHRPLWLLAFAPGQPAPFQAHHRLELDVVLASSNLDALDLALTEFTPPPYARAFLGRRDSTAPDALPPAAMPALAGVR